MQRKVESGAGSNKKHLLASSETLMQGPGKRQLAWLERDSAGQTRASWRPIMLHRTAAKRFVMGLDRQVTVCTSRAGLKSFIPSAGGSEWQDWSTWPMLAVATDMGPDAVCGFHAMANHYRMNVMLWPDPSHAAKNAFGGALRAAGAWDLLLLFLISVNFEYGPWHDEARRGELAAAMPQCYKKFQPHEQPMFMALMPQIRAELEGAGIVEFPRKKPIELEVVFAFVVFAQLQFSC